MKTCIDCGKDLVPDEDWPESYQNGHIFRHKLCDRVRVKENDQFRMRASVRLGFNKFIGGGSQWSALPKATRKAEIAKQRLIDAEHEVMNRFEEEYDPAEQGADDELFASAPVYEVRAPKPPNPDDFRNLDPRIAKVYQRHGHQRLATYVKHRDSHCLFTGDEEKTDTAHILPWSECDSIDQQLDPNNCITMRKDYHVAWDASLIHIRLNERNQAYLWSDDALSSHVSGTYIYLTDEQKAYLTLRNNNNGN